MLGDDFFEVDGLIINESATIAAGALNPYDVHLEMQIGSIYIQNTGDIWKKYGPQNFEWSKTVEELEEVVVVVNDEPQLLFINDKVVRVRI